jgi:NADPH2:quinone reductase
VQALQVHALSPDLSGTTIVDLPLPKPGPGEVLVKVRAASLNFPDLLKTRGEYQLKPPLPFVPGTDVAGEVVSAPPDSGFSPSDAVVGGTRINAFAEYIAVVAEDLRRKPPGVSFETAAAFGAAYHTAWVALVEIGQLKSGQWELVHGAAG